MHGYTMNFHQFCLGEEFIVTVLEIISLSKEANSFLGQRNSSKTGVFVPL